MKGLDIGAAFVFTILVLAALSLSAPLFWLERHEPAPELAWAPGYWERSPRAGITRVVPIAPASLINPTASAAPADLQ